MSASANALVSDHQAAVRTSLVVAEISFVVVAVIVDCFNVVAVVLSMLFAGCVHAWTSVRCLRPIS